PCPSLHRIKYNSLVGKVGKMNSTDRLNQHTMTGQPHKVEVNQRKEIEISGVKELDSFDNEELLLETTMRYLIVRGEHLQLKNLNVEAGFLQITGKLYEITYLDDHRGERAIGLVGKVF